MQTIPQAHPDRQETTADHLFLLALQAAYRCARAQYPQTERMVKGYHIAAAGKVTLLDNGSAEVASQFNTMTYVINGQGCPCEDTRHQGDLLCKHRWAKALVRKATTLLQAAVAAVMGDTPGAPCPACGHPTVMDVPVWGPHTQRYVRYRVCDMVLQVGDEQYVCGWREITPRP